MPLFISFLFQEQTKNTEQRINLLILGPIKALEMLQQVYEDNSMSCKRVCEWHKMFEEGHNAVEMNPVVEDL